MFKRGREEGITCAGDEYQVSFDSSVVWPIFGSVLQTVEINKPCILPSLTAKVHIKPVCPQFPHDLVT